MTLNGLGNQYWMTLDYEETRVKALEDRSKYDTETLELVDVYDDVSLGGGETDDDSYKIKQFPYPVNSTIRRRKTIDLRDVDPSIGGK